MPTAPPSSGMPPTSSPFAPPAMGPVGPPQPAYARPLGPGPFSGGSRMAIRPPLSYANPGLVGVSVQRPNFAPPTLRY